MLIDRIRKETSVLLLPGEMLGVGSGVRFGYRYDIEHTMEGLACINEMLSKFTR